MYVDIGGALSATATPGVPRDALDRLDARVGRAHDQIEAGRADRSVGYAALDLPERTDPGPIRDAVPDGVERTLTVGIGGSALGATALATALSAPQVALDNVDPAHTRATLDALDLDSTLVHVVSSSGTTAETRANLRAVRRAFRQAGVDWTERTLVTTGPEGPFRDLAAERGLPVLDYPEGVPGRFAALSAVGLVPLAVAGRDIEGVLAGAREAALSGSLFDCPAYAYGAAAYALRERGATTNAVMPYAEALEPFAEWTAQLWAESLGKEGLGQTPVRALGATDQHSQLQLYRAGPRDKFVTLVRPRERPDLDIGGDDWLPASMAELVDAEFRATAASLAEADRPAVQVEIDRVDERGIGELLFGFEAACVLYGELSGVETFTQPAVEWAKQATRGLCGSSASADAAAAREVETRESLVVGE
jgi:glucose-6-phosphate isomerase